MHLELPGLADSQSNMDSPTGKGASKLPSSLSMNETLSPTNRILSYIDGLETYYPLSPTPTVEPKCFRENYNMSTTSASGVSTRSKTLTYADGSSFADALREMGVQQTSWPLPDPGQMCFVFEALEEPSLYENKDSLSHAMQTRSNAPNETSFYLVFEFLLTGWLCKLPNLRYVFNAQWRVEPLDGSPHAFQLAAPKPDITIGYNEAFLTGACRIHRPVVDSAPVVCDHRLEYPCVTIEAKPNETPLWLNQNLHNAAVMLHILRSLWTKIYDSAFGFDNTIRAVTISVSRNLVDVFGHWTATDDYGDVVYHFSHMTSWSLGTGEFDWQRARWGLKCYVEWVMRENQEWIINALRQWRHISTQHY